MTEQVIIRAKWIMDGSTSLAEAALKVRAFADKLAAMHADGWRLEGEIEDDYGFAVREEP